MSQPTPLPRAYVYVDGFNLYYGIRNTPHKWLNVATMCQLLLPSYDIQQIRYFTAKVKSRPQDPDQHVRQRTYLRALETLPNLTIVYGHFLSHRVQMPEHPITNPVKRVWVMKTEEKGSDVNLAAYLLDDAHRNQFDVAAVISNDSDLVMPIRMARAIGKTVGVLIPPTATPSQQLARETDFFKPIRNGVLQVSQFPNAVTATNGTTLHKPIGW